MNLPKAIELLRKDLNEPGSVAPDDLGAAKELGIEALKFKQWWDKEGAHIEPYLLPGETED